MLGDLSFEVQSGQNSDVNRGALADSQKVLTREGEKAATEMRDFKRVYHGISDFLFTTSAKFLILRFLSP